MTRPKKTLHDITTLMRVDAEKGSVRWADDIEELLAPPPQIEVGWRATQRASQLLPSRRRAFAPRHRPTMRHKLRNSLIEQRIERVIPVAPTLLITSPTRRSIVRRQRRHPNGAEVEPIFESMVVPKGVLKGATGVVDFGVVRVPQGGRRRSTVRRVTPPAPPLPSGPAPPIVSFGRAESCANAPLQDLPPTGETGSTMVGSAEIGGLGPSLVLK